MDIVEFILITVFQSVNWRTCIASLHELATERQRCRIGSVLRASDGECGAEQAICVCIIIIGVLQLNKIQ